MIQLWSHTQTCASCSTEQQQMISKINKSWWDKTKNHSSLDPGNFASSLGCVLHHPLWGEHLDAGSQFNCPSFFQERADGGEKAAIWAGPRALISPTQKLRPRE